MATRSYIAPYLITLFLAGCATMPSIGPLYSYHCSAQKTEWALRPFVSRYVNKQVGISEYQFLYPLGRYKKSKDVRFIQFIPFIKSKKYSQRQDKAASSEYFPFFWGKTKEGKPYGGVFPLYGQLRERFGDDRIIFILWPLYASSKYDDTARYQFLWPFFTYTKGNSERGFRVWPLYGLEEKEGMFSKRFIAWPFFIKQMTRLDTKNPRKFLAFFPFFVSTKTPSESSKTILFPFFTSYQKKEGRFHQYTYPWPLLGHAKGDNYESRKVLPLYSYKKTKKTKSFSLLWPLYRHEEEYSKTSDKITDWIFLISRYERTTFGPAKKKAKTLRFWPLFSYQKSKRGGSAFDFPAIIPTKDEGFERNYGPLLRIYEYRKDHQGNKHSTLLWGLYHYSEMGTSISRDIPLIFSYKKDVSCKKLSLLKGALEYQIKGDRASLRLLYLPWRLRLKD